MAAAVDRSRLRSRANRRERADGGPALSMPVPRSGTPVRVLIPATIALLVVGVVAVYDSSYARAMDRASDPNGAMVLLLKQLLYACLGVICMVTMARYGYWRLRAWAAPLLIISFLLLIAVWVPHIGVARNGAHRWVGWGIAQIQPSELAKMAMIVYLAALLSRASSNIRSFADGLLVPVTVMAIFVGLVEREPDMGTAIVIFLASMTVLYLAGARKRHLALVTWAFLFLAILVLAFGHGFRKGRMMTFLRPQEDYYGRGYQITRGLVAVGSGGMRGVGIGAGREKFYLPEANTDFIFATIAEETGLIGAVGVVGLLFLVGWQGFLVARRTRDTFGAMLAAGIAAMISWQAVINIAVVTGSIPATGVPLPFISYGGSSLVFLLTGIGILLSISANPDAPGRDRAMR